MRTVFCAPGAALRKVLWWFPDPVRVCEGPELAHSGHSVRFADVIRAPSGLPSPGDSGQDQTGADERHP